MLIEPKNDVERAAAKHSHTIRISLAETVVKLALHYGPEQGIPVSSLSVTNGCLFAIKDQYDTFKGMNPEAAAMYAQDVITSIADLFKDSINVSVVRRTE